MSSGALVPPGMSPGYGGSAAMMDTPYSSITSRELCRPVVRSPFMVSSVMSLGVLVPPGMSPGYGGSTALMDTAIPLHNITRIVQVSSQVPFHGQ